MNGFKVAGISIAIIAFFYIFFLKEDNIAHAKGGSLMIYCAAGIKEPIEMAMKEFKEKYDVNFTVEYRGTGNLYGTLETNKKTEISRGDLFISADNSYTDKGKTTGIVQEILPLASQNPVLIVKKGNPKNIQSIHDLLKPHVKIVLANPKAASVGRTAKKILSKIGIWDDVKKNIVKDGTFKPTVLEVAFDVAHGSMDVGIVWDPITKHKNYIEKFSVIQDPDLKKSTKHVTIGVLTSSKNPTLALRFARFLHARDKGQKFFKHYKFQTIENADHWAEKPIIKLMSGGVNRIAIEETLKEFEKREGVKIETIYNGCGILVGQMKANEHERPDAYFACDISFVKEVKDIFKEPINVAKTDIVIAVPKKNPHNIQSINDLNKSRLKIGAGHPKQSALGSLTVKLLKSMGKYELIRKNISSEAPSADIIVTQLLSGSLDAVIVYRVNLSKNLDKFHVIDIKHKEAHAIQPFAIAKKTSNHYLIERLLDAIEKNGKRFENAGFSLVNKSEKSPWIESK